MTTQTNDNRKQELFERIAKYGRDAGNGEIAKYKALKDIFQGAADLMITSDLKDEKNDDVRPLYIQFSKNQRRKNLFNQVEDVKSVTQQVSKFRAPAIVGGMPIFRSNRNGGNTAAADFITLCDARIMALAATVKGTNPGEKFSLLMTAQKKKQDAPLTSDEIDAVIEPKEAGDSELKDIRSIMTKLKKLAKDYPGAQEYAMAAHRALAPRLSLLETEAERDALASEQAALDARKAKLAA